MSPTYWELESFTSENFLEDIPPWPLVNHKNKINIDPLKSYLDQMSALFFIFVKR